MNGFSPTELIFIFVLVVTNFSEIGEAQDSRSEDGIISSLRLVAYYFDSGLENGEKSILCYLDSTLLPEAKSNPAYTFKTSNRVVSLYYIENSSYGERCTLIFVPYDFAETYRLALSKLRSQIIIEVSTNCVFNNSWIYRPWNRNATARICVLGPQVKVIVSLDQSAESDNKLPIELLQFSYFQACKLLYPPLR